MSSIRRHTCLTFCLLFALVFAAGLVAVTPATAAVTALSVASDTGSPVGMFQSVRLTASATTTPGGETVEYRFLTNKDGAGWQLLRGYEANEVCQWTPSLAGSYQVRVDARVVGSAADYERQASLTILVRPLALQVTCTPAPGDTITPGTPMTITATAVSDPPGANVEYRLVVDEHYNFATWSAAYRTVLSTSYGQQITWTFTPRAVTTYRITVYARIIGSAYAHDTFWRVGFPVASANAEITSLGVTLSPNPLAMGSNGLLTATATTSPAGVPLEYRFWYGPADTYGYGTTLIRDYGPNTCVWTPTQSGYFGIYVEARVVGSTAAWEKAAVLREVNVFNPNINLTVSYSTPSPGNVLYQPLTITATATGYPPGTPLEYRFEFFQNGDTPTASGGTTFSPWSPSNNITVTPKCDAAYRVFAQVRQAGSTVMDFSRGPLRYVVNTFPPLTPTGSFDKPSPVPVLTPITLSVRSVYLDTSTPPSQPVEYSYRIEDKTTGTDVMPFTAYMTTTNLVWTPTQAGQYRFHVMARTVGSTALHDGYWQDDRVVTALRATLAGDPPSPIRVQTPVTLTAGAVGFPSGANLEYRFEVRRGNTWTLLRDYAASNTAIWTPTTPDLYWLAVYVRQAGSTSPWETYSWDLSYTVQPNQPPVAQNLSYVTDEDVPVDITLVATDGEGDPLTYTVVTPPQHGTLSGSGANLIYTPAPRYEGPDSFTYKANDGRDNSNIATVSILMRHVNHGPIANAGADQSAPEGAAIALNGTGSVDPDSDPLSYAWTQLSGPAVTLAGADTATPSFSYNVAGSRCVKPSETFTFQLTVSDGEFSDSDAVTVTVLNGNVAPVADAGSDQTACEGAVVSLSGAVSDADGDPLSYAWTQLAGPAVSLAGANTLTPSFAAPDVSLAGAVLTFQLTVNDVCSGGDATGLTGTDTVNVHVKHVNQVPVAEAGPDQTVPENTVVTLTGANSYDPDDDFLSYAWTQLSGPAVTLSGNGATPTFTSPDVGPEGAVLKFQLVVTDQPSDAVCGGAMASDPDTVTVTVQYINRSPAVSGADQTVNENSVVTLSATGSDPDGNPLSYQWTQTGGALVTLSDSGSANPTFTAPAVPCAGGALTFHVAVSDGFGGTAADDVTVTVLNINNLPVANAGFNQAVRESAVVTLNGSGSSDADGEALSYAWTQVDGPVVTLSGADTATPSFTAPVLPGTDPYRTATLVFELVVNDTCNSEAADIVEVVVSPANNAPIARASSQTVCENAAVTLNGAASSDPDNDPISYAWVQVGGPTVVLSGANTATPTFTAPWVGPAGETLLFKLTVTDSAGLTGTDVAQVALLNCNTPPNCSNARASQPVLWPPNSKFVPVTIIGVADPDNNATIQITGVMQDEPLNSLGDGDFSADAIIQGNTVLLRAERSGTKQVPGDGRVYHIYFTATDAEGQCSSSSVTVCVPHDMSGRPCVDQGPLYDATAGNEWHNK